MALSKFSQKLYNFGRSIWDNVPQEAKDDQELDQHSFITGIVSGFEPYCLTKNPEKMHRDLLDILKAAGDLQKQVIYRYGQRALRNSPMYKNLDNESFLKGYMIIQLKLFSTPFVDTAENIRIITDNNFKSEDGFKGGNYGIIT